MARKLPVTASNASCMPEILRDAVLYFDPRNKNSIADAMRELASSEQLRGLLVQKGLALLPHYSWDTLAKDTINVYQHALLDNHA